MEELARLEIWPDGSAIELEDRDIPISVHGLVTAILPAMLPSRAIAEPSKREAFVPQGVKKHKLYQADNAVLLVTELPSEIVYTIDYFQWHAILKAVLADAMLREVVLMLANQEEVIIDYNSKKVYRRPHTSATAASVLAKDLHKFFQTGEEEEE